MQNLLLPANAELSNSECHLSGIERNRIQNSLQPGVALPDELLASIFELLCCNCSGTELSSDVFLLRYKAWRANRLSILGTCSRWREIALSTSSLWALVLIDSTTTRREHILVRQELERAGTRLLLIRLNTPLHEPLRTVIDHDTISRFGTLSITCQYPLLDQLKGLLSVDDPLPNLTSLFVIFEMGWEEVGSAILDVRQTSNLRSLYLSDKWNAAISPGIKILPPPEWHSLRNLTLHGVNDINSVILAISTCHEALEKLVMNAAGRPIRISRGVSVVSSPLPIPPFPRLRYLSLCPHWHERIAIYLIAPNLSRLRLDHCQRLEDTIHKPVYASFPNLDLLEINGPFATVDMEIDDLTSFIIAYGSIIKKLVVDGPCVPSLAESIVGAMSCLPRLQDIYLKWQSPITAREASLIILRGGTQPLVPPSLSRSLALHFHRSSWRIEQSTRTEMISVAETCGQTVCFDCADDSDDFFWM